MFRNQKRISSALSGVSPGTFSSPRRQRTTLLRTTRNSVLEMSFDTPGLLMEPHDLVTRHPTSSGGHRVVGLTRYGGWLLENAKKIANHGEMGLYVPRRARSCEDFRCGGARKVRKLRVRCSTLSGYHVIPVTARLLSPAVRFSVGTGFA